MIPAPPHPAPALYLAARRREDVLTPHRLDGPGRIHSLYPSSVNLLLANGCFCTLFSPTEDSGPGGIILSTGLDFTDPRWGLEKGLPIMAALGRLTVGPLRIDATAGDPFPSALLPSRHPLSPLEVQRGLQRLEGLLPETPAPGCEVPLGALLHRRTEDFRTAFCSCQSLVGPSVEGLVGLGLGLTPSGDDFLTGCLATLWYSLGPGDSRVERLRKEIALRLERTTFISAQMLQAACEGRFRASLQKLVAQVFRDDGRELQRALDALLAVGASSGRDMAAGVLAACRILDRLFVTI